MGTISDPKSRLIKDCKVLLLASKFRYPQLPSYNYPIFMLMKYIRLQKLKMSFKLKTAPQELLSKQPDANNCVLISENYYKAILLQSDYVQLISGMKKRLVRVVPFKLDEGEIYAGEALNFNLNATDVKLAIVETSNIQTATEVDVSLITSYNGVGSSVTASILKAYFKTPKLVHKGDLFAVNLREFGPEFFYTSTKHNGVEYVYFKCNMVSSGGVDDCVGGYFCEIGETTLKQSADCQSALPARFKLLRGGEEHTPSVGDLLLDLCPYGLQRYVDALEKAVKPFITSKKLRLNPTFLIQGPKGSGKGHILATLAHNKGLKLCKLSTNELSAHAYAQTEVKTRNAFFRAKLCSPCIVAINNFENFGKNNEGQHDPRIINNFKTELNTLLANNEHPIILICMSNTKELPSELGRIFLESITVEAPSQNERGDMLKWILLKKGLQITIDINEVAGKTHGFLFEDLEALVYYAVKNKVTNERERLSEDDFEIALDIMQSSYTESLGAPKVPKVQWSDVGGLDDVKHDIIKTINLPLKHPELLKGGLRRSGILLYGPPGTGKTLIAKAVATECGLCFLSVKGPELLNMYVGQSEQNVREVFERARQASPCIIFFDELDSLAPNRGASGDAGGVMDRVVSQLLAEMDGLNENATVFVIGATNRPDLIDPPLLRPGRFDILLYVGPCTSLPPKLSVLKALTRRFKLSEKLQLDKVVKICPENITGADFYGICSNAWMFAASRMIRKIEKGKANSAGITHDDIIVTFKDFEDAIKTAKPSIKAEDLLYFEKLRRELSAKK